MEGVSLQESLENNEEDEKVQSGKSLFHHIYFKCGTKGYLSKETWLCIREKVNFTTYTIQKETIGQKKP